MYHACPNCGYCPHCGRGGYVRPIYPRPYIPPPWPRYPMPYVGDLPTAIGQARAAIHC